MFCVECDQNICELCVRPHKKTSALKDHHMFHLKNEELKEQERKANTKFCPLHATEPKTLYCFDCDVVHCKVCQSNQHQGHKCTDVEKVRCDFKTQLRMICKHISMCLKVSDTVAYKLQDCSTALSANVNDLRAGVEEQTRLVMSVINQEAQRVLQDIESIHSNDAQCIQFRKDETERHIATFHKFRKYVLEIIENGADIDLGQTYVKLKRNADELQKDHQSFMKSSDHLPSSALFTSFAFDEYIVKSNDNVIGKVSKPRFDYNIFFL